MATVRLRAPLKRLAGDRAELSLEGATVGGGGGCCGGSCGCGH